MFVPQAGTWGLQGIVGVPDRPSDYVFFVTFGQAQGDHEFDEFITDEGVLSWQSQPKQSLKERRIQDFINHREEINNIHLFLRTNRGQDYTYFGRLKYLDHDPTKENPVYFQWQILDWPAPKHVLDMLGDKLVSSAPPGPLLSKAGPEPIRHFLRRTDAPRSRKRGQATLDPTKPRQARRPDYLANHAANQALGLLGELLVLKSEQDRLVGVGRRDLAEMVRHVSVLENDTAGYDILSFEEDGSKRFIEVKTTRGSADADFFISASELEFAKENAGSYWLYRVYNYVDETDTARFYSIKGALEDHGALQCVPTNFKVSVRREDN